MQTQYCPSCGKVVQLGIPVCPYCGVLINSSLRDDDTVVNNPAYSQKGVDPVKSSQYPNNGYPYYQQPKQNKSNSNLLWILASVLFVILLVVAIVLFVNKEKNKNLEAEKLKTQQVEMELEQLQKEKESIEQNHGSLSTDTTLENASVLADVNTTAENTKQSYDGSYSFSGTIKNNRGTRQSYWFSLSLNISNGNVTGSFQSANNSGPVKGTIDSAGNMKVKEYNNNGSQTGYYWKGKFNGKSYSGKYLCTYASQDMTFWTN